MYAFRPTHVLQLVVGMVLLAATFALLVIGGGVVITAILTMIFGVVGFVPFLFMHIFGWFPSVIPKIVAVQNLIWLSVILGLLLYGAFRSKPGYVAAPFVFCALWFGASLVDRKMLEVEIAPQVWAAPVPPEARSQRTLIVDAKESSISRRLTDRHIDRLITIDRDNRTAAVTRIQELINSRCVVERQGEAGLPHTFACYTSRDIGDIPDGLVVERVDRFPPAQVDPEESKHAELDEPIARIERAAERAKEWVAANPRNCDETQAKLRERGQERVLFSWSQCQPSVRAYIPQFGFSDRPTSVWGFALGRAHKVVFGPADIAPAAMISAIYGIDDSTQPGSRAASP
jgi:hypothetical protein